MSRKDAIFVCGDDGVFEKTGQDCPNYANHEPMPRDYVSFDEHGKLLNKTRKNVKCPGCGLYKIWVPRKPKNVRISSLADKGEE